MSSFNLLQILPALKSGGVERGVVDLSNHFSQKKIINHIISSGGGMEKELDFNYSMHQKMNVNSKFFLNYPFIAYQINKYIHDKNINIVHVRSRGPAWITNLIRNTKIKKVATFHNIYNSNSIIKKIYNKGMSKMDFLIANSNYVKNEIIKKYNLHDREIKVINRGIDTDFFYDDINEKSIQELRNKYKINQNKKIILFPGRITRWKGQLEFLKNITILKDSDYIVCFTGSIGNKLYYENLKLSIKKNNLNNNCKIFSNVSKGEFKTFLKISKVVLSLPIIPEGFGRTISESLSMNKVVLGFDYGGVKDQLDGLDQFFKIPPKNYDEVIKKILQIEKFSEQGLMNLTSNCREHIINKFSLRQMVNEYEHFYENITNL